MCLHFLTHIQFLPCLQSQQKSNSSERMSLALLSWLNHSQHDLGIAAHQHHDPDVVAALLQAVQRQTLSVVPPDLQRQYSEVQGPLHMGVKPPGRSPAATSVAGPNPSHHLFHVYDRMTGTRFLVDTQGPRYALYLCLLMNANAPMTN